MDLDVETHLDSSATEVSSKPTSIHKHKSEDACIKLIDNKRKKMERSLSAAQRDKILLTESKEDRGFKKEMVDVLRESSRNTASAITEMSTAIGQIGTGLCRSIEILATVFGQHQHQQFQPTAPQFNNFVGQQTPYTNLWSGNQGNRQEAGTRVEQEYIQQGMQSMNHEFN